MGAEATVAADGAFEEPAAALWSRAAGASNQACQFLGEALVQGVDEARRAVADHKAAVFGQSDQLKTSARQFFRQLPGRRGSSEAAQEQDFLTPQVERFRRGGQQSEVIRQAEDRFRVGWAVRHDAVKAGRILEGSDGVEVVVGPDRDQGFFAPVDFKAAMGNQSFEEPAARVHESRVNVTVMGS